LDRKATILTPTTVPLILPDWCLQCSSAMPHSTSTYPSTKAINIKIAVPGAKTSSFIPLHISLHIPLPRAVSFPSLASCLRNAIFTKNNCDRRSCATPPPSPFPRNGHRMRNFAMGEREGGGGVRWRNGVCKTERCTALQSNLTMVAQSPISGLWDCRLAAKRAAVMAAQKSGSLKQDGLNRVFKPASPGKKPTAPHAGETQGTISAHFPHIPVPSLCTNERALNPPSDLPN